jgi:hypothetical protein
MNDFDDVILGATDPGEDVAMLRTADGHAILLPLSLTKLHGEQLQAVADLQSKAVAVRRAQTQLRELVLENRDLGVSWAAIGWSVGTSGEAARQRWGDSRES